MTTRGTIVTGSLLLAALVGAAPGVAEPERSRGQTVYVPVYSHIFADTKSVSQLTTTLTVRNTDGRQAITLTSIAYYDTAGALVREHAEKPLVLGPLATHDVVVARRDTTGGVGANFLVSRGVVVERRSP